MSDGNALMPDGNARLFPAEILLGWFAGQGRDLPWRHTRDPWLILVSELMLQQTQAARVVPKYEAFLRRFPTVGSCARSGVGEVVTMWQGLGYNRRAVNLHRASVEVMARFAGVIPRGLDDLLSLRGIGPYTARAVQVFAFELDVGVLDTNVARILARWEGRPLAGSEAQQWADALVPPGRAWSWNQAMLDLGATVCSKRSPACERCPVPSTCAWAEAGSPLPDPAASTAGTSGKQSIFEGSDRQGRGRLVNALRAGPVDHVHLADAMGWPADPARAERVAETVVRDGLAYRMGDVWHLI